MNDAKKATTLELPPTAANLLATIRSIEGWVDRKQLADGMKKKKLNAGEIAYLDVLTANGLIEKQRRENRTPIGFEWVYRAIVG